MSTSINSRINLFLTETRFYITWPTTITCRLPVTNHNDQELAIRIPQNSATMENEKGEIVDLYVLPTCRESLEEFRHATLIQPSPLTFRRYYDFERMSWSSGSHSLLPFSPNSYVPRKCSATNRIIKAKDHASVQISIAKVDENGRYTGENQVYALCGFVRARGESDDCLNRLAQRDGLLKSVWSANSQR